MKEYIEREFNPCDVCEYKRCSNCVLHRLAKEKVEQTAADVVERKRGEWILGHVEPGYFTPGGNRPWVCSECGQVVSWHLDKPRAKFCNECGADMREVQT